MEKKALMPDGGIMKRNSTGNSDAISGGIGNAISNAISSAIGDGNGQTYGQNMALQTSVFLLLSSDFSFRTSYLFPFTRRKVWGRLLEKWGND